MCVTAAVAPRWLTGWLAGNLCIYMYVSVCQQQQQQAGGDLLENQLWKKAPPLSSCKLMRF